MTRRSWWPALLVCIVLVPLEPLAAQEVVGKRVFSDQIVISEPFVEDEVSLPSLLHIDSGRAGRLTGIGGELKKRVTSDFEVSVSGELMRLDNRTGFDNMNLGLKYEILRDEAREAVASVALLWEIGGTGRAATGAERFDTVTPSALFGKGLGDVPERFALLRPLALAGLVGVAIPVAERPSALAWGLVIEYSVPYLESFVRHVGLPRPVDRFVPLVELDLATDLAGRLAGRVRGTANPGVVWIGEALQVGTEAVLPVDERSGRGVGVRAFLRIPLEAVFGERAGEPLWGAGRDH